MIDDLQITQSAYFFRVRSGITRQAIQTLFAAIRDDAKDARLPIVSVIRRASGTARVSALAFSY